MFIREIRGYAVHSRRPIYIRLYNDSSPNLRRRDGRVAEGARLESVFRGNSNVGSNPTLSAILLAHLICLIQLKIDESQTGTRQLLPFKSSGIVWEYYRGPDYNRELTIIRGVVRMRSSGRTGLFQRLSAVLLGGLLAYSPHAAWGQTTPAASNRQTTSLGDSLHRSDGKQLHIFYLHGIGSDGPGDHDSLALRQGICGFVKDCMIYAGEPDGTEYADQTSSR